MLAINAIPPRESTQHLSHSGDQKQEQEVSTEYPDIRNNRTDAGAIDQKRKENKPDEQPDKAQLLITIEFLQRAK